MLSFPCHALWRWALQGCLYVLRVVDVVNSDLLRCSETGAFVAPIGESHLAASPESCFDIALPRLKGDRRPQRRGCLLCAATHIAVQKVTLCPSSAA